MSTKQASISENLLEARQLNRRLSDTAGVYDISLKLRRGDVLGLLGLNGAGKSTTLKMLAGTLVPDSGDVFIGGHSMSEAPLQARQHLGYLPDTPPLYNDLRVLDYLQLCAALRCVPKALTKAKVEAVMAQCDLDSVARQRITQLSKGFRQRVGLAQAMVHEPSVLLLDEPSNGLDPNQMQSMRSIIKQAGQNQAVVFSTHLLNEAQAVCNRIAIVHQGKLVHEAELLADNKELETLFSNLVNKPQQAAVA